MSSMKQNVSAPTIAPLLADPKTGPRQEKSQNYKGFVAGVFSGIAKLSGNQKNPLLFINTTNTPF